MPTQPAIVHLIGFPAAGKLTIARAITALAQSEGRRFVVVDNHFLVLSAFGALPARQMR
jgi:hypothetical protein